MLCLLGTTFIFTSLNAGCSTSGLDQLDTIIHLKSAPSSYIEMLNVSVLLIILEQLFLVMLLAGWTLKSRNFVANSGLNFHTMLASSPQTSASQFSDTSASSTIEWGSVTRGSGINTGTEENAIVSSVYNHCYFK